MPPNYRKQLIHIKSPEIASWRIALQRIAPSIVTLRKLPTGECLTQTAFWKIASRRIAPQKVTPLGNFQPLNCCTPPLTNYLKSYTQRIAPSSESCPPLLRKNFTFSFYITITLLTPLTPGGNKKATHT